jgi:hypothetical protein
MSALNQTQIQSAFAGSNQADLTSLFINNKLRDILLTLNSEVDVAATSGGEVASQAFTTVFAGGLNGSGTGSTTCHRFTSDTSHVIQIHFDIFPAAAATNTVTVSLTGVTLTAGTATITIVDNAGVVTTEDAAIISGGDLVFTITTSNTSTHKATISGIVIG